MPGAKYTVRNLVTNKLKIFHIKLLREFLYDSAHVDPMCDEQFYEVEKVLPHKGTCLYDFYSVYIDT